MLTFINQHQLQAQNRPLVSGFFEVDPDRETAGAAS